MTNVKKQWGKILSTGLCLTLICSNVVFAYQPEKTFWDERRKSTQAENAQPAKAPQGILLAQLSGALSQSPSAIQSFGPAVTELSQGKLESLGVKTPASFLSRLLPNLSVDGIVKDIHHPGVLQNTQANVPIVVYIQDVHGQLDAQKNIAALIEKIVRMSPNAIVGLEGAAGDVDPRPFRGPDAAVNREVGSFFLHAGTMGGPELAAMSLETAPRLMGLEDPALYQKNVAAVRRSLEQQSQRLSQLDHLRRHVLKNKARVFSPQQNALFQKWADYHSGVLPMTAYIDSLMAVKPIAPGTSAKNLAQFLRVRALETSLDFGKAESERDHYFKALVAHLDKDGLAGLVEKTVAFKTGALTYADYFREIQKNSVAAGIKWDAYPQFARYIEYVLGAESIAPEPLMTELAGYEQNVWTSLCQTPEQKLLFQKAQDLNLLANLIGLKLTTPDWQAYQSRKERIDELASGIDVKAFEGFYEAAQARDQIIAANLKSVMSSSKSRVTILVAGGFHSSGLIENFQKSNVTLVVVAPKLESVNGSSSNDYLSLFSQKKTPLEKLFEAPKISLVRSPLMPNEIADRPWPALARVAKRLSGLLSLLKKKGQKRIEMDFLDGSHIAIGPLGQTMPAAEAGVNVTTEHHQYSLTGPSQSKKTSRGFWKTLGLMIRTVFVAPFTEAHWITSATALATHGIQNARQIRIRSVGISIVAFMERAGLRF